MKSSLFLFLLFLNSFSCSAQTDTMPYNAQDEVMANRVRVDNKNHQDIIIFLKVEGGQWFQDIIGSGRNYIFLNDCGIPERNCKKELAICSINTTNCRTIELKGGMAYIIIWDGVNGRWDIAAYK